MKLAIECVIVSAGYGDILRETLPLNFPHFDRIVVVTVPDDRETIEVCRRHGVWCRPTRQFTRDGAPFAKGRGIDYGMAYLDGRHWICQLDADMVLPAQTRQWLEWIPLDEECIYGIDRFNCCGWDAWLAYKRARPLPHDYWCRVNPPPFPISARISIREYGGYLPIGSFQLWHGKHGRRYPLHHGDAERTDILHSLQWEPEQRRLIPELMAIHIESERAAMGTNWKGRKTKRFGPPPASGTPGAPYGDLHREST